MSFISKACSPIYTIIIFTHDNRTNMYLLLGLTLSYSYAIAKKEHKWVNIGYKTVISHV